MLITNGVVPVPVRLDMGSIGLDRLLILDKSDVTLLLACSHVAQADAKLYSRLARGGNMKVQIAGIIETDGLFVKPCINAYSPGQHARSYGSLGRHLSEA